MATPLTADQFVNALRAEGVRVVTVGEWRTHNRNHKGAWGPIHGCMLHHTAGGSSGAVEFCYDGMSDLPGPLCHGVITKDGTVHIISTGRSNHAGGGDPNVLAAVKDERYGDRPPVPHQHQGTAGAVDGNPHFYGFECVNLGDGKDPWPAVQVDAMVRASAAICRTFGWTEKSTIAHREWSDYKPDPAGPGMPGMPAFRAKIAERLAHPASWNPTAPTEPTPTGTPMAPFRTTLIRNEDITLLEGIPAELYWTSENTDEGNEHGAGGKTVITAGRYDAVLNLTLEGLEEGEYVEVYAVEENTSGQPTGEGPRAQYFGHGTGSMIATRNIAVPVMGYVYERLTFRIVSSCLNPVTVTSAQLNLQHWGN